jgi:TrpR family transcriptional regulator, trp operon repressor
MIGPRRKRRKRVQKGCEAKNSGIQLFLKLCQQKKVQHMLDELFTLFFTPEERENINARSLIIQALIESEMTQREIADHFGVSIGQITRGSNALKAISPELQSELIPFFKENLLSCSWRP